MRVSSVALWVLLLQLGVLRPVVPKPAKRGKKKIKFRSLPKEGKCTEGKCIDSVGTWTWPTADQYKGNFDADGVRSGPGLFQWNQTKDIYEGTFKNGLPSGVGLYMWGTDTQRYIGQFEKGRKSGLGVYRNVETGETYAGEFKNGLFSGYGRLIFDNGTILEGKFLKGWPDGVGKRAVRKKHKTGGEKESFQETGVYYGQFSRGRRHGYGVSLGDNDATHSGRFNKGAPFRYAVYKTVNTRGGTGGEQDYKTYMGTYSHGFHGHAALNFTDLSGEGEGEAYHVYYGEASSGMSNGYGQWEYSNGEVYIGETKDGMRHGQGVLTSWYGDRLSGNWSQDSFVFGTKSGPTYAMGSFAGEFNGSGQFQFGKAVTSDGNVYEGEYYSGSPSGFGVATSIDGTKYCGEFKTGQRDGYGVFYEKRERDVPTVPPVPDRAESQSQTIPYYAPLYAGLWYQNKFVEVTEPRGEDDGADGGAGPLEGDVQGKTEDLSAKDIADMKQRAHDTGFQAQQIQQRSRSLATGAIEASRRAQYVVANNESKLHVELGRNMSRLAKISHSQASQVMAKAEKQMSVIAKVVQSAKKIERMVAKASKLLTRKQRAMERKKKALEKKREEEESEKKAIEEMGKEGVKKRKKNKMKGKRKKQSGKKAP